MSRAQAQQSTKVPRVLGFTSAGIPCNFKCRVLARDGVGNLSGQVERAAAEAHARTACGQPPKISLWIATRARVLGEPSGLITIVRMAVAHSRHSRQRRPAVTPDCSHNAETQITD